MTCEIKLMKYIKYAIMWIKYAIYEFFQLFENGKIRDPQPYTLFCRKTPIPH